MVVKFGLGETCSSDGDCDLGHCVDGVCCNASCEGTCLRCNVAGSIGTCIEVPSNCTGCSICSSGNCIADPTKCTGNCVQCIGSGTAYSCSAKPSLCTGSCSFCTGADTEYNCAGSNGFCSNTVSSCYCSGSGTVWNCQACSDTYGVCGHPTCSSNSCGNAYDNGVYCAYNGHNNGATNYYCSSGSCLCTSSAGTSSPDGKDNNCNGTKDEIVTTPASYGIICDYMCTTEMITRHGGCHSQSTCTNTYCNGNCGAWGYSCYSSTLNGASCLRRAAYNTYY